jgi:NDP-sugar pyrophosphorylase family protein
LSAAGVRDVVLNLHHLPHTLTRLLGDGAELGMRIRYSW